MSSLFFFIGIARLILFTTFAVRLTKAEVL